MSNSCQLQKVYTDIPVSDKVKYLFQALCEDEKSEDVRHFACILLRRLFFTSFEEVQQSLDENSLAQMKVHLLVLLQKDNISLRLRKKICDVASEVARNCVDTNGNTNWPELLQFMFSAAESNNHELRECALSLIS